jgi:hypothetical protein
MKVTVVTDVTKSDRVEQPSDRLPKPVVQDESKNQHKTEVGHGADSERPKTIFEVEKIAKLIVEFV